jgi:putative phosphoribosyl transferase
MFGDRRDAGRRLGARLAASYSARPDVIVLALPRGGVPVGFEVARALDAPLDVFLVRKLGVPGHEELAMGAIATGGVRFQNDDVVRHLGITEATVEAVARMEEQELRRREESYRGARPAPALAGRTAILVDDGLATGASMKAAVAALRRAQPARIVVAVPVSAEPTCRELSALVDEVVCLATPISFMAVGQFYEDFSQTTDAEVKQLLQEAADSHAATESRS